jgi:N-methylhydantoinase A/oxoprolinase/acetone carboxylase beta subunit
MAITRPEARAIAREVFGDDLPISISSDVVPEMQEYERTETTVVNSYVAPEVSSYLGNLQRSLEERLGDEVPSCRSCAPTAAWPHRGPLRTRR